MGRALLTASASLIVQQLGKLLGSELGHFDGELSTMLDGDLLVIDSSETWSSLLDLDRSRAARTVRVIRYHACVEETSLAGPLGAARRIERPQPHPKKGRRISVNVVGCDLGEMRFGASALSEPADFQVVAKDCRVSKMIERISEVQSHDPQTIVLSCAASSRGSADLSAITAPSCSPSRVSATRSTLMTCRPMWSRST